MRFLLYKRILSAIGGILLLSLFVFWGSLPFFIFITLLSILEIYEYNRLAGNKHLLVMFLILIIVFCAYLISRGYLEEPIGFILLTFMLLCLFSYHLIKNGYSDIYHKIGSSLLGLIYIGGGMSFFVFLHNLSIPGLWLAMIATWATDTGAYFTGKYFGKRKLASQISPNKTIEGALGGILLTVIIVTLFTSFFMNFSILWIIYSVLLSLFAIIGDLFESCLKRSMEVKDSGSLIPGHGGILDRFDSLLFTIPFTYFYLILFFK